MAARSGLSLVALVVSFALGCSSGSDPGGGDPPPPAPVASVTVTAAQPSVVVGASVQMLVSTLDASGNVLTGRTMTWSTSDAAVATVDGSGSVTGKSPGTATITATSEGRTGSAPITVLTDVATVVVSPNPAVVISTLSVQLTATAHGADGLPLTGKTFTWTTADVLTATVDGDGQLTGGTPGATTVSAASEGIEGEAAVDVLTPPPVLVASVNPNPLIEGEPASITGVGFSANVGENTVTLDGVAAVVTQATSTALNIVVPAFDCLPKRSVGVQVTVAAEPSNVSNTTVSPAILVLMAVGDQVILEDPSGFCMQFDESAGAERYIFGVQSVSEVAATLTSVRVSSTIPGAAPVSPQLPQPALLTSSVGTSLSTSDLRRLERWTQHAAAEGAFLDRSNSVLNPLLASGGYPTLAPSRTAPALIPGDVMEGTVLSLRFPGFDTDICADFIDLPVIVRKVSTRAIIVEDTDNPAGGFVAADFDALAADFDGTIYDVDVDFFGEPSDMDANDRIVIVVTKEVNKLTTSSPLAFVNGGDLFPATATGCLASNEGEFYYTRAPDPSGIYAADTYLLQDAKDDGRLLLAHEFTHIIQSSRRMAAGGSFMTSFMAEGGATAAQEFVGFEYESRMDGQNYGGDAIYSALGADPNGYYTFMRDLVGYFGFDFNDSSAPGAPEQCTWVGSAGDDTLGPCTSERLVYGPTWSLVRHGIDLYGTPLGGAKVVHRALVDYTGAPGFAAIETVFGKTIGEMMAVWAAMLYVDDRFMDPALDMFQFVNWDLRSVEEAWNSPAALLTPRARSFADFQDDFSVRAASNAFFDISGAARPATAVRIRDQSGNLLPDFFQVWIVRVE